MNINVQVHTLDIDTDTVVAWYAVFNRPYSRSGHDGQKERLGWQIYCKFARQYVNSIVTSRSREVTSLFRHLPYDVLFKKSRHCFNI